MFNLTDTRNLNFHYFSRDPLQFIEAKIIIDDTILWMIFMLRTKNVQRVKNDKTYFYARDCSSRFQEASRRQKTRQKAEGESEAGPLSAVWPERKISVIFHTPSKCHVRIRACSCVRDAPARMYTCVPYFSPTRNTNPTVFSSSSPSLCTPSCFFFIFQSLSFSLFLS